MSRAFTREEDSENAIAGVGERPISTYRNLVTERGLAQIEENLADLRDVLAKAEKKADRERIAVVSRDLRYWTARRENAELSVPEPGSDVVRFGMPAKVSCAMRARGCEMMKVRVPSSSAGRVDSISS